MTGGAHDPQIIINGDQGLLVVEIRLRSANLSVAVTAQDFTVRKGIVSTTGNGYPMVGFPMSLGRSRAGAASFCPFEPLGAATIMTVPFARTLASAARPSPCLSDRLVRECHSVLTSFLLRIVGLLTEGLISGILLLPRGLSLLARTLFRPYKGGAFEFSKVRAPGFEPGRDFSRRIKSPLRLPISPRPRDRSES